MAKYKAYPEYKDSGVEWVGEIPEHWKMSKVRYCFSFDKGLTITKENLQDEGIPCLNYGEIHSKYGFEFNPSIHPLKCVDKKYLNANTKSLLCKGDIIFADTSEDIIGSGNFSQLVSEVITFAGYHTIISRPINRESYRYLAYTLDSQELRSQIQTSVKGVKVFSISQAILRGLSLWLPRVNEQKNISTFLDYHTAKIDILVEKQLQLIELLKEKRQAVVSHAVTKGLNTDIPMNDSGVEWFGDVPSHWLKTIIKHIGKINPLKTKIAPDLMKKECSFIPMENLKLNKIILDEHRVIKDVYNSYTYFEDKDILMAKVTPCFENKNIAIANNLFNGIGFGTTEIYVIRCNNQVNNEFLFYRLQEDNFSAIAEGSMTGAGGLKRVPHEVVNSFQFYLPTIYEQNEIASFLNSATTKIDTLIQKQRQQIDLLKERRTALISAAVTGKIDLRDWTPPASSTEASFTAEEATA